MLSQQTRDLVRATAPILMEHGPTLTRHFYARMFAHNPELKEMFNQGNQQNGAQSQALAMAVAAYASHIDDPSVLLPVLERVCAKHMSLGIRQEHYGIVGKHLLASISEVLGAAATPELIDAWAQAYGQLAELMINLEQNLYTQASDQEGGWSGWRSFQIQAKVEESSEITSFYLAPASGEKVPSFLPGQYISLRVLIPQLGYKQPRQYSLSCAPGADTLRISVKREDARGQGPAGMVSNYLHQIARVGDIVEIAPPAGDFYLHQDRSTPVVLVSAGVGITPMLSMFEHLAQENSTRSVRFIHAARNQEVQAFAPRLAQLDQGLSDSKLWIAHENPSPICQQVGRLDLPQLSQQGIIPQDADFYICGPAPFMAAQIQNLQAMGIAPTRIHAEAFGTGGVQA